MINKSFPAAEILSQQSLITTHGHYLPNRDVLKETIKVASVYEIHRYHHDDFQYTVARTSKYSDERVRKDIEEMNSILSNEMKAQGIRYVFAIGSTSEVIKQRTKKSKTEDHKRSVG